MQEKHSDKGINTLKAMNTLPENWKLCPIKWVVEKRWVMVEGQCPTCGGHRFVPRVDGKVVNWTSHTEKETKAEYAAVQAAQLVWNNLLESQNTRAVLHNAWSIGDCPDCLRKNSPYGYRRGKAMVPQLCDVTVGYPQWPAGTKFDSRFGGSTESGHWSCALCSKEIIKSNLTPVIGQGPDGKWHGMWVGCDCAKKFFQVKPIKANHQYEVK